MREKKRLIFRKIFTYVLSAVIACSSLTACSIKLNLPKNDIEETTTTQVETTIETTTIPETTVQPVELKHAIDGSVSESTKVDSSYFDDAVFIGDSISDMLKYYEMSHDKLGKAQFLTAGSLSATNALWDVSNPKNVFPKYNGKVMKLEDSVPLTGARKIYIMLGMNDISMGEASGIANYTKVIQKIKDACPDSYIFVESVTPRADIPEAHTSRLTNETITSYNKKMASVCKEKGWNFINVAEVMYDNTGFLKKEYCSDISSMGMHFTYEGCAKWVEYLYTHTVDVPPAPATTTSTSVASSTTQSSTSASIIPSAPETTTDLITTTKNN